MSLRLRLVLAAASAVAVVAVLFSAGAYVITSHQLRREADASFLRTVAQQRGRFVVRPGEIEGVSTLQSLQSDGSIVTSNGTIPLPVGAIDRRVASEGGGRVYLRDATVDHQHIRIATVGGDFRIARGGLAFQGAAQFSQSLDPVDKTLRRLIDLFALLALGGIALAAALGRLVARAALAPVERLTTEAERVAATRDLSASIQVEGVDEIARLGTTLNAMLAALDESQRAQRRLVADASHELRTPLTSLRTNLEVLARSHTMSESDRQSLLGDLIAQVAELGTLVGQLVDLDKADADVAEVPAPLALDEVVGRALARARRNAPAVAFVVQTEPVVVVGVAAVLERAVSNLLDNAAKWSPPGATVEVSLQGGLLTVRDHGPGIDPADAPHVFERFYRSVAAKGLPGSGLGLSIVSEAAEEHGGRAWVEPAPGGGTIAAFQVPLAPAPAADGRSGADSGPPLAEGPGTPPQPPGTGMPAPSTPPDGGVGAPVIG